jgi:hypothetical protein
LAVWIQSRKKASLSSYCLTRTNRAFRTFLVINHKIKIDKSSSTTMHLESTLSLSTLLKLILYLVYSCKYHLSFNEATIIQSSCDSRILTATVHFRHMLILCNYLVDMITIPRFRHPNTQWIQENKNFSDCPTTVPTKIPFKL